MQRRPAFGTWRAPAPWLARTVLIPGILCAAALCFVSSTSAVAEAPTASSAETVEWQISERGGGHRGGEVVVSLTAEPRTFMPLVAFDGATLAVVQRMNAGLIRRDGQSFELQPSLATSWSLSPDHRQLTLELRHGVRFSDGEAFDADDVIFSIQVAEDRNVGSAHADGFIIDGKPVEVTKLGSHRVRLTFPGPHPLPIGLLNDFPILPEHLLHKAYRSGRLSEAWSLGTEPAQIAGLGPFRLAKHEPGQRLVLERNPHYWRRDAAAPAGSQLPYLDRIVYEFVADETAKVLRFRTGESDLLERVPGDQFNDLEKRAEAGTPIVMRDLGPGLGSTFVIFNLNDVDLPEVQKRQRWLRQNSFRRAVSQAVDRRGIARLVYHGRATPVVSDLSPGNTLYWSDAFSAAARGLEDANLDAAQQTLEQSGFTRNAAGNWQDQDGEQISLTLVTNTSNSKRAATATVLQEDLRRLGLDVTFVGLEFSALVQRLTQTFDYDLLLLEFGGGDLDPSTTMPVWTLGGASHYFRLGAEKPAFPWEAEIDRLMRRQARETDPVERRRLVGEVQELLAREAPLVFLVAPNVLVGADAGLGNFAPSILEHPTLWNCDELYWPAPAEPGSDAASGAR